MKRLLKRLFRKQGTAASMNPGTCRSHTVDRAAHDGFKTRPGQGPFLLSFDGRVIPLRKARFLRRH